MLLLYLLHNIRAYIPYAKPALSVPPVQPFSLRKTPSEQLTDWVDSDALKWVVQ